jgi:hypothetical protein
MKNVVFWDVTPCGSYRNRSCGEISAMGTTLALTSKRSTLLVAANVVPISPILVTPIMEAIRSSVTSVLSRATLRRILEGDILQIRKDSEGDGLVLLSYPFQFSIDQPHSLNPCHPSG